MSNLWIQLKYGLKSKFITYLFRLESTYLCTYSLIFLFSFTGRITVIYRIRIDPDGSGFNFQLKLNLKFWHHILYFYLLGRCTYRFNIRTFQPSNAAGHVYDTIVVGLGAAGCAALGKLARRQRSVLGLEAMDRIGGRVHTLPFGHGLVELGAEWYVTSL